MPPDKIFMYDESERPVKAGDYVLIWNGESARVNEILLPHTKAADGYSCGETGGVLYNTASCGLVLVTPDTASEDDIPKKGSWLRYWLQYLRNKFLQRR